MEEKSYYKMLVEESAEEKSIWDEIRNENKTFESTPEYIEHEKRLKALYDKHSRAHHNRLVNAEKFKPKRWHDNDDEKTLTKEEFRAWQEERKRKREEEINALPKLLSTMVKNFYKLTDIEKEKFSQMVRNGWHDREHLPKMENPKTTKEDIRELQKVLVQTCINYINDKDLDIDAVSFGADSLQTSAKYEEWTPATDSSITVEGIGFEKGKDGKEFPIRKIIGYSF